MHLSFEALEAGLNNLPPAPTDQGRVELVVVRTGIGTRDLPAKARLTSAGGLEGDRWGARNPTSTDDQITLMRGDVGRVIGNGQELALFGDNLVVELDLSEQNLPPGTRLRIGRALCEVTAKPHTGCAKYSARFGPDALEVVNGPRFKAERFRGMYVRVLEEGEAGPGDPIQVLSRPA